MTVWHAAAPDAAGDDDGAPRETSPAEAQRRANFVVFEPGWLPEDCAVEAVTLRPERPPDRDADGGEASERPASLRIAVAGADRRFRLKQFLYDWAPPAASVAPLWRTPEPTPFDCPDAVGWLGTDYKGNRGACVQRARTQIEASVLEGTVEDAELRRVLAELTPLETDVAAAARRVPFHRLSYPVRYRHPPPSPPHGLWDHAPVRPYDACDPVAPFALGDAEPAVPTPPADGPWRFDSAVQFPDADAVEGVFRHRENGSDHLWLCGARPESPLAPALPPEPSDQPAAVRETVGARGTTVHYAALTPEDGAWEAVWEADGVRYVAWAGASQFLDLDGFLELIDGLAVR